MREVSDVEGVEILSNIFAKKATSTLARRDQSLRLFIRWFKAAGLEDIPPLHVEPPCTFMSKTSGAKRPLLRALKDSSRPWDLPKGL